MPEVRPLERRPERGRRERRSEHLPRSCTTSSRLAAKRQDERGWERRPAGTGVAGSRWNLLGGQRCSTIRVSTM
ncbi:hypothetical protein PAMP_013706 [Pampus punctatissimus]